MLGMLHHEQKTSWSQHLAYLVHVYNATQNDATGVSPYLLMFGRQPRLPIDLCFGVEKVYGHHLTQGQYARYLRDHLQ